jgi:hypothetical protein
MALLCNRKQLVRQESFKAFNALFDNFSVNDSTCDDVLTLTTGEAFEAAESRG